MLNLDAEKQQKFQKIVDEVRQKQQNPLMTTDSAGASSHSETQFDGPNFDITLQFDYNAGNISAEDEAKLRFIMQFVQNQGTNALADAKKDFTHDSEAWIEFFARYPLLFNFRSRRSKKFEEKEFSLTVNTKMMDTFIDAKAPADIKEAFKQALQDSGGEVLSTTKKNNDLQYLALIRSYDKAATLTIYRAMLKMEVSTVKTLCGGTQKAELKMEYDEIVFEINNMLALAIYPDLSKQATEVAIKFMKDFFLKFAEDEFKKFYEWLKNLGK